MRRSLLAGLVTTALTIAPALAQPRIESVELGFNGRFLPGALTPIVVVLRNTGSPQDVSLEISQEVRDFTERRPLERVRIPVRLAPGARKKISVDFPIRSVGTPVRIALVAESAEITRTEIEVRERWSEAPLVLGLAVMGMPAIELLEPERLPGRWTSYEGVARILWGRLDPARLTPEQRLALLGWLVRGGELVILSGDNWYEQFSPAQSWWADLLPITNGRVVRRELKDQEISWLEGDLHPRGRVVASDAGRPFVWERPIGNGRVLLVAFATLPHTLELPHRSRGGEKASEGDQMIVKALGALVVPSPSREVIGGLLVAFVIGVGLAGMLATRWRKAPLGIALASVVLSLVLFQYQHSPQFSSEKYAVHLGVVRIWSDQPLAWEQDWYGVFSRRSDDELLSVSADYVRALRSGGDVTVEITAPQTRVLRFRRERDSTRFFAAERMTEQPVQFTVNTLPPQIRVYNRASVSLQDAVVHLGDDCYRLGTIAAQTELSRSLGELSRVSKAEWLDSLSESRRMLWRQWGDLAVGPVLIGWFEESSVWAKAEREARTTLRLVTVQGG
jgi:hypothetical protein